MTAVTVPDQDELAAYAAGRWPVVVRTLVLLGAPPRHAQTLAVHAVSGLLDRCADDEWVDLDVVLSAEVVDAWAADRTPWWNRAEQRDDHDLVDTGVPAACAALDALAPHERARLVVGAVVGLTTDQLDDALGPVRDHRPPRLGSDAVAGIARLAEEIPSGEPRVEAARTWSQTGRRHGRGATIAGLVAGLAAVVVLVPVVSRLADRTPSAPAARSAPGPSSRIVDPPPERAGAGDVRSRDLFAVPWYDDQRVYLLDRTVRVPRLAGLALSGDGVVATDEGGRVLHVRSGGAVEVLGRTDPAAPAVADGLMAAWVDRPSGDLVLRPLLGQEQRTPLPAGSRVTALDGRRAFVDAPGRALVVGSDAAVTEGVADLLDASAGTVVTEAGADRLRVTRVDGSSMGVAGTGATLSPDALHLVTRSAAQSPGRVVVETATGATVPLPLPEGSVALDAAFGVEGQVTFVVSRPDVARVRPAGFDLTVCDLETVVCRTTVRSSDPQRVPVLAR